MKLTSRGTTILRIFMGETEGGRKKKQGDREKTKKKNAIKGGGGDSGPD